MVVTPSVCGSTNRAAARGEAAALEAGFGAGGIGGQKPLVEPVALIALGIGLLGAMAAEVHIDEITRARGLRRIPQRRQDRRARRAYAPRDTIGQDGNIGDAPVAQDRPQQPDVIGRPAQIGQPYGFVIVGDTHQNRFYIGPKGGDPGENAQQ